ncbi:hypothetical protein [Streptomyces sp. NBC_01235]|uniref:hypothetical protein n=1 Tax=Streptomyces sp. NBC_01235 TaxID=2903788 RepID=UPI002E103EE1|nr:hypothetical protein OG289_06040 [Streptomyces sp. NBC_01235]
MVGRATLTISASRVMTKKPSSAAPSAKAGPVVLPRPAGVVAVLPGAGACVLVIETLLVSPGSSVRRPGHRRRT